MGMDSHCLIFTKKMGYFKGLMWVGEMWLNKQKEVEDGGWSSRTVCKYQSTEEKQQLCVCGSRRSWRHPRGLYVFHAEHLPVTITWQNRAFDTLDVIFMSVYIRAVWHERQGSLVRKHTLAASVVTAARSFLWSVCVWWLWGCWWLGLFSMTIVSQFLLSWHPYCALGLRGPVCPAPQWRISGRGMLNYPRKQKLMAGSLFLKNNLVAWK